MKKKSQQQPDPPPMDEVPLEVREQDAPAPPAEGDAPAAGPGDDWPAELIWESTRGRGRKLKECLANATVIFGRHPAWAETLAYNEFRGQVESRKPPPWGDNERSSAGIAAGPWTDEDDLRAKAWLERHYNLALGRETVAGAVLIAAERQKRYHPVREYLEGLRWDGEERLDLLFPWYFDAEPRSSGPSQYLRLVSRWWTIAAVARIFDPGCKADCMVILEGQQGARKSSALAAMAVRREWFLDSPVMIGEKDGFEILRGKWIIEFAELDSWRRADQNRLKGYLTQVLDSYRGAYARRSADHLRQCIFAGSTNEHDYLDDPTGGRRFWPVACEAIRLEELQRDRDQLWAEAVHQYKSGGRWWPVTEQEQALCRAQQAQRYREDSWEPKIAAWLADLAWSDSEAIRRAGGLTSGVVLERCLAIPAERWQRAHETRVGVILKHLGYERRQRRHEGERVYVYAKPEQLELPA